MESLDIIRVLLLWEKKEQYAGVAYGRIYGLNEDQLCLIKPEYKECLKWDEEKIHAKEKELQQALETEAYVDEFILDNNLMIQLVDNLDKLLFCIKKLYDSDVVAFDVEAGYVCQSVNSLQQ